MFHFMWQSFEMNKKKPNENCKKKLIHTSLFEIPIWYIVFVVVALFFFKLLLNNIYMDPWSFHLYTRTYTIISNMYDSIKWNHKIFTSYVFIHSVFVVVVVVAIRLLYFIETAKKTSFVKGISIQRFLSRI